MHAARRQIGASTALLSLATSGACPSGTTALSCNQVGPTGAHGATGPKGATGAAGPAGGVAHGYLGYHTSCVITVTQTATIVAQTPKLPAGTYVINASIDMFTDGQSIYCFDAVAGDRLHHSGTLAQTLAEGGSGSAIVTLALTDAATVPSGTRLAYYCASNGDNVSTSDEEITAIPVNAITTNS